jgi:hypothetical protein
MFLYQVTVPSGKACDFDQRWPFQTDHQKPELSNCCIALYVKCNQTGF